MEHKDLGKRRHQQLFGTALATALLALPVGNLDGCYCVNDAVRQTLLSLSGRHRELDQRVGMRIFVVARITLDRIDDLESTQLVEERKLVAQELEKLMRISDAVTRRHNGSLHAFIQCLEPFIALATPDFLQCLVDGRRIQSRIRNVACLDVRNSEDSLKCCIDPARATLITKSERHLTFGT